MIRRNEAVKESAARAITKGRGGRPPKFREPRRPVTVTLPERTLRLLDAGNEELVLFIYGAPPVSGGADFFDDVP